jgi:hypothetical protein
MGNLWANMGSFMGRFLLQTIKKVVCSQLFIQADSAILPNF